MAERRETKLWSLIRQGTKKFNVHWTRIENLVDTGTPDTWGVYKGVYFPVELKMEESDWIYMRPSQIIWMRYHILAGGTPSILYRTNDDRIFIIKVTLEFIEALIIKGKYLAFKPNNKFISFITTKPYKYEAILETLIKEEKC